MKGNTLECLHDYLNHLPWGTRHCTTTRQELMSFVGVNNVDTLGSWRRKKNTPKGLVLIKIRYFLEKEGYQVTELKAMQKLVYDLGKLISYNILQSEEVATYLGYTAKSALWDLLHGNRGLLKDKAEKIKVLIKQNKEALTALNNLNDQQSINTAPNIDTAPNIGIGPNIDTGPSQKKVPPAKKKRLSAEQEEESPLLQESIALLTSLKGITAVLTPRLKQILETLTVEQRRELRKLAGRSLIFDLSNDVFAMNNLLGALCSEKARELKNNRDRKEDED
ncbi:hypothetical protein ACFL2U_00015 [Patescibacteria group bacterium]